MNVTDREFSSQSRPDPGSSALAVKIEGDLSIGNADELRVLFARLLGERSELVVDFAQVQACDTAGLQLILSLRKTALLYGRQFRVVEFSPAIEEAATAIGLSLEEVTAAHEAVGGTAGGIGCGV